MFNIITDKSAIKEILDNLMRNKDYLVGGFVPYIKMQKGVIWSGAEYKGGLTIEGSRPISASTDCVKNKRYYSLSNDDSGYQSSIGSICLDDIIEIGLLPK